MTDTTAPLEGEAPAIPADRVHIMEACWSPNVPGVIPAPDPTPDVPAGDGAPAPATAPGRRGRASAAAAPNDDAAADAAGTPPEV